MPQLSRSEIAMYAACAVVIAVLGWKALQHDTPAATSAPPASTPRLAMPPAPSRSAVIHVVGAVRRPGVYRLEAGQRVQDAIRRAGGAKAGADLQAINLAAKLADAQQVVVPQRAATIAGGAPSAAAQGISSATSAPSTAAGGPPASPINLNSATAEQLDTLDGVGPATAQKILQYRTEHGGFSSIDDLGQIPGIGPKRLEALRPQVQL